MSETAIDLLRIAEFSAAAMATSTSSLPIKEPRFVYVFVLFVIGIGIAALLWPCAILLKRIKPK